jgi:hypothetical protein
MLFAVLAAIGSVALGLTVAFLPRAGTSTIGRVRTFALVAAITVVVGHLLPEATEHLGALALALVMLGVVAPSWIETFSTRWTGDHHHHHHEHEHEHPRGTLALEIGYIGLVVHHVFDGVALWAYRSAGLDVVLALAAHTVPVIAVVVLEFGRARGQRAGVVRAIGLAIATLAGIAAGAVTPEDLFSELEPWIAAFVAGLLLHVIAHDLQSDPPRVPRDRLLDLFAAVLGVLIPYAISSSFDPGVPAGLERVLCICAPWLAIGLIATTASERVRYVQRLPLRFEALALVFVSFGALAALLWTAAVVIAPALATIGAEHESDAPLGWFEALDQQLRRVGPWLLVGAMFAVFAAPAKLDADAHALALALVAIPSYFTAVAGVPLAAVFAYQGVPVAALVAALAIGPVFRRVREVAGIKRALAGAMLAGLIAVMPALVLRPVMLGTAELPFARAPTLFERIALAGVVAYALRVIWHSGFRSWIAGLVIAPRTTRGDHA